MVVVHQEVDYLLLPQQQEEHQEHLNLMQLEVELVVEEMLEVELEVLEVLMEVDHLRVQIQGELVEQAIQGVQLPHPHLIAYQLLQVHHIQL